MDFVAGVPQTITQVVPVGSHAVEVDLPCVGWPEGECVKVSIDWENEPGCSATFSGGVIRDRRGHVLETIKLTAEIPIVGKSADDMVNVIVTIDPIQDFSSDVAVTVV